MPLAALDYDGERFELPINRDDRFQRELIELGLRVSFDMAQENECAEARSFILKGRFDEAVMADIGSRRRSSLRRRTLARRL